MPETTPTPAPDATLSAPDGGPEVVVIGAGPAGLTAAFQFHKYGVASTIIDRRSPGGSMAARRRMACCASSSAVATSMSSRI